jgi:hypothetical protein
MSREHGGRTSRGANRNSNRGRRGSSSYDEMTKDELLKKARQMNLPGRSSMNRQQLVDAVRKGSR